MHIVRKICSTCWLFSSLRMSFTRCCNRCPLPRTVSVALLCAKMKVMEDIQYKFLTDSVSGNIRCKTNSSHNQINISGKVYWNRQAVMLYISWWQLKKQIQPYNVHLSIIEAAAPLNELDFVIKNCPWNYRFTRNDGSFYQKFLMSRGRKQVVSTTTFVFCSTKNFIKFLIKYFLFFIRYRNLTFR